MNPLPRTLRACTFSLFGLAALPSAQAAVNITLQPDEASSKDVFVYQFGVPGVFGIPTPARSTNLDTQTLAMLDPPAAVPFGNFLGSSNTDPLIGAGGETRAHDTRTLIQFDLGLLNLAPSQVGSAWINLYAVAGLPPFADPSATTPIDTELRRVLSPWGEATVTWDNRPMVSEVIGMATQTGVEQWVRFDVTALVRDWLAHPASNLGVELSQPDIVMSGGKAVASLYRSSNAAEASLRPFLSISAVPEPHTYALFLAGLGLLGWSARRPHPI